MKLYFYYILSIFVLWTNLLYSQQSSLEGNVSNANTKETLPGVTVTFGKNAGTLTDANGNYKINLSVGTYKITFSYMGFVQTSRTINIRKNEKNILNITLEEEIKHLDLVVVSGSAYEKKLNEETVSMDIIKPYIIENSNSKSIDEALQKVPGVKILDGQASLRGGSSYSYGTGSRVQVVVDGQSYLSPDLGDVRWKFVPIDNIEQIEVIKGAASVLYGSSSMNGVINILTGWPKAEPSTEILTYQGIYTNPSRSEINWWKKEVEGVYVPSLSGATILHKQKFNHFDVVVGARFNMLHGYIKTIDENRVGIDFKTRYRHPKKNLTIGLNANVSYEQNTRFMFYKNSNEGAYLPLEGSTSFDNYYLISITPNLTYFTPAGNRHKLTAMYFNVTNFEVNEDKVKPAQMVSLEYQYQHKFRNNLVVTSGLNSSIGWMNNKDLYNGISPKTIFGSAYTQIEKKIGRLTSQLGLRYEMYGILGSNNADTTIYNNINSGSMETNSGPIFRLGLNYQTSHTSFLRASFGQAYRFPSVSEKFMNISVSQITVLPNPNISSEKGWNAELGLKKELITKNLYSYIDVALFWMEYDNFITYSLGSYYVAGSKEPIIGFKPFNINKARISGLEITLFAEGNFGKLNTKFYGGYTYTYPIDLESGKDQENIGTYVEDFFKSIVGMDSLRKNALLYYRNRHIARFDLEATYNKIGLGISMDYSSNFEKIEQFFGVLNVVVPGVADYTTVYKGSTLLFDARIFYNFNKKCTLYFIGKNITNKEYSERPGLIGPPRSLILQFKYKI